ncbi:ribosome biogenesis protein [Thermoplasmatales archaeon ex4572_165]|nr:MAG: ribosome biogenesis protein [Thermoplasmatales archaeon ex4572_165]RLF59598.1 MAG: ribosome biogenesis protein [Thermoplasmata archaeon]
MTSLYYCSHCKEYTLQNSCSACNNKTIERKPARFSPQDHYGLYRRELKKQQLKEEK